MDMAQRYLESLNQAYAAAGHGQTWAHFTAVAHGISPQDREKLLAAYPQTPAALLGLLDRIDGSYWREYRGEETAVFMLGSDMAEYPYYLLSAEQMLDDKQDWLHDYIRREYEQFGVEVDGRITDKPETLNWLHFADCANNGGTSMLFVDFSPSPQGVSGQIVRFVHDPDELTVIAGSFEQYLQKLLDDGLDFIRP
ncbi:MAG: SMI1/KNR4 family protein [Neisseria sp.]|nr:SMI1/KNR4 family protein [Neisseria sp.]